MRARFLQRQSAPFPVIPSEGLRYLMVGYNLYVPADEDLTTPKALVIALHGLAGNAPGFRWMTGWNKLAASEGFIVAYPQGTSFPLRWNTSPAFRIEHIDDVQFVQGLLIDLEAITQIDRTRIYVNGFSQGATLAEMLACELADQLVAVGMVEGYGDASRLACDPVRPLPLIAMFGTQDVLGEPQDYPQWFYDLMNLSSDPKYIEDLPMRVGLDLWIENNRCDPGTVRDKIAGDVHFVHYDQCADGAQVHLCWLEGAGHTWLGGRNRVIFGETSEALDASQVLWAFFDHHQSPDSYARK